MAAILVVDDSATIRHMVELALKPLGVEVVGAADGRAALEMVEKSPPVLVLTDLNMPELSGTGLLDALRRNPTTRTTPVLLMTTAAEQAALDPRLLEGVTAILVKPFDVTTLLGMVRPLLVPAGRKR